MPSLSVSKDNINFLGDFIFEENSLNFNRKSMDLWLDYFYDIK